MLRSVFAFIPLLIFISCNSGTPSTRLTFAKDVAPIIYRTCSSCHRPGSAGPFDLLTYDDVYRHLKTISLTVRSGIMPPWPADPTYRHFRSEKVLTENEKKIILDWIDQGAEEGARSETPATPVFPDESLLGKPDLILSFPKPFFIEGNNQDHFMMMKLPYTLPKDTFLRLVEIVPGNRKLVHHINAHLIQYEPGAKKSVRNDEFVVNTEKVDKRQAYEKLNLANDDGTYPLLTPSVTNYLPGVEPVRYPEGIGGYRIKKEGVLLLDNIHYGPSAVDTSDDTKFNFFFSPVPPSRPARDFILGTSGVSPVIPPLVIPPDSIKTFRSQYLVPENISLLTVNPHMHLLGKSFLAYAINPGGDTIRIIRIPKWDFRWQYFYTFENPLEIPAGSLICIEGVYDNTSANPLNPFSPPRTVSEREGSMRTTDEMFQLIVTYIPYQTGDEKINLGAK